MFKKIKNFFKGIKNKVVEFFTGAKETVKEHVTETVVAAATVTSVAVITGGFLYFSKARNDMYQNYLNDMYSLNVSIAKPAISSEVF